jgi:acetylglutamate/LysW-gamma-L-alpha-aminoadipate kinase
MRTQQNSLYVLKLGGGAGVEHRQVLQNLAERVANGERWILVHGVSNRANELAQAAGIAVRTITSPGGHVSRYTDSAMIALYAQAVQAVNAELASQLETLGVAVCAFAQAGVIAGQRKTAIRAIQNGRPVIIRDDFSGRITGIDVNALSAALDAGQVPVIAPIALGENGENLNVDGDVVAAEIARQLQADTLVILSNVPGLLRDVGDVNSVINTIPVMEIGRFANYAQGRMKKKLLAAETAHIRRVILADSRGELPLDTALNGAGTHIIRDFSALAMREVAYADYAE